MNNSYVSKSPTPYPTDSLRHTHQDVGCISSDTTPPILVRLEQVAARIKAVAATVEAVEKKFHSVLMVATPEKTVGDPENIPSCELEGHLQDFQRQLENINASLISILRRGAL